MKTAEQIKLEAYESSESLSKVLKTYSLNLDEIGVFYLEKETTIEEIDTKNYPVSIFYSIAKNEIKKLKVDFTNSKIQESVINIRKNSILSIAS